MKYPFIVTPATFYGQSPLPLLMFVPFCCSVVFNHPLLNPQNPKSGNLAFHPFLMRCWQGSLSRWLQQPYLLVVL